MKLRASGLVLLLGMFTVSCASRAPAGRAPANAAARFDAPWEVTNELGETVLPDLFYADDAQNEQLMEVQVGGKREGRRKQIDRLVYPTLGNPKLFVRTRAGDSVLFVLRLEPEAYAHLQPEEGAPVAGKPARVLRLREDAGNRLGFFLIPREERRGVTESPESLDGLEPRGDGLGAPRRYRVTPSVISVRQVDDRMPEVFRHRRTLEVTFSRESLSGIPAGLYDIRFEVLRDGRLATGAGNEGYREYQYNALRIFDSASPGDAPEAGSEKGDGRYTVINVTDTQLSTGLLFKAKTIEPLKMFVASVNASADPRIRNAAFITFNGDLHNGGVPNERYPDFISGEYNREANAALHILKELRYPVFLTPGNHDGYVSVGKMPWLTEHIRQHVGGTLEAAIAGSPGRTWKDYDPRDFERYLDSLEDNGGRHVDIFTGRFVRRPGRDWSSWKELPRAERNYILYDGFYQWQKTFGPLYFSFRFGRNHYVNMNTFDLRQHRRSGWGMYTLNYGGGLSPVQLDWVGRELERAQREEHDVILLGHHDPRGGHNGVDYPYYFEQVDYTGKRTSTRNYLRGEVIDTHLCEPQWPWLKRSFAWIRRNLLWREVRELSCMHDGLQEWMRADRDFDCPESRKGSDGRCPAGDLVSQAPAAGGAAADEGEPRRSYSGYALLDLIARYPNTRTFLLGHTHWNSLEVLREGDELVPGRINLDYRSHRKLASELAALEAVNPNRADAWAFKLLTPANATPEQLDKLMEQGIVASNHYFALDLEKAGYRFSRKLQGIDRELAILRMTSASELSSQKYQGRSMHGFSVFSIYAKEDGRSYALPQLNGVTYYQNVTPSKAIRKIKGDRRGAYERAFREAVAIEIDRTRPLKVDAPENPVHRAFTME